MQRYNPKEIEPKWQQQWASDGTYAVDLKDTSKPKFYGFAMLPYPSGTGLHTGHVRTYTLADVTVRAKRQQGYNAYNPIGWDAFGLPAENYAIKTGTSPQETIATATARFREQLTRIGMSHDWSKEIDTSDPAYYKWTQWIFTQLLEHGLAYQKESAQWWCPVDQTVLANEQVEAGKCWRCGNPVQKKLLKQWFFKITDYADELLESAEDLDWPGFIKTMQRNWIGRSQGAEISWQVTDKAGAEEGLSVETFTTRKDTIPGVTFIVVAPESALLDQLTTDDHKARVHSYRRDAERLTDIQRQEDKSKTGVFTGKYARNPFNGALVPIYAASYVLAGYGTGVVMGMGGHDLRDREFSLKHDIQVILTTEVPEKYRNLNTAEIYSGDGLQINSGEPYDGLNNKEAGQRIFEKLVADGVAKDRTNYKIRDWLISRQRYWGAPIPIVHCDKDGAVAIPAEQLPVELPVVEDYKPNGGNTSVLAGVDDWVNTTCPKCGGPAKRETDTMDGYACSSWYFLRYLDPHNDEQAWDPAIVNQWMPVDLYNGADHAVSHLLYARFWMHFFYKIGLVNDPEPVKKLVYNAYILATDGTKMSKSKGNVVDPLEIVDSGYGADSLRVYEMFIAPYDLEAPWDTRGVPGCYRFLQRAWNLTQEYLESPAKADETASNRSEVLRLAHATTKKVTEDIAATKFNTAVAAMMEAVNGYMKLKTTGLSQSMEWRYAVESLVQLMAPFAPHIAEELWSQLGHTTTVHCDNWPAYDKRYLIQTRVTIVVQVNGKLRGQLQAATNVTEEAVVEQAKADENVRVHLYGKEIVKIIFVPGKLVNFVVK